MFGFEKFVKSCRMQIVDGVESTAKLALLFQVQTYVSEKYNFGWADCNARNVYVILRGNENNYGAIHDNSSFEIW